MADQETNYEWDRAANIVRDAGGKITGRTKLQKIAYLLSLAGLETTFQFTYHHYGPYSEDLSDAISAAEIFDLVTEEEKTAEWGGTYSIYRVTRKVGRNNEQSRSYKLAAAAVEINSIELELAATAAYLHVAEKVPDPWQETARRKPEKTKNKMLEKAQAAYAKLRAIEDGLPDFL